MRIVIDLQGAQSNSRFRGIGRYSTSLAKGIIRNAKGHEVYILLNGMLVDTLENLREEFLTLLPQSHILVWQAYGPVNFISPDSAFRRESAEIIRESFLASLNPDLVIVTSMIEGYDDDSILGGKRYYDLPTASVFYDAIPLLQADKYLEEGSIYQAFYLNQIQQFKACDLLLGISQSACLEAIDALGIPSDKVANISAAVDERFQQVNIDPKIEKEILEKYKIKKDFLLITGATDERKNHLRLIKAFSLLPSSIRDEHQLVIAGGLPYRTRWDFIKYAKKLKLKKDALIFTDWVEDDTLIALYNLCELFVYPSWHEGFGLPVLEAMKCGVAVIGSNTTSIPEIIGDKNALFDPFDAEIISHKIAEYLSDKNKRTELAKSGLERSKAFSWDICGQKVWQAIEKWQDTHPQQTQISIDKDIILQQMLSDISALSLGDSRDIDLLNISQAIAFNHPKNQSKQLLIDISELVKHDAKSGIQRVVRNILREMLENPVSGYIIKPVYADNEKLGYFYAEKFLASFASTSEKSNQETAEDEPIDLASGDIFLGLDMAPDIQRFQAKTYMEYRALGIEVYFVVYDLLTTLHPEWFVLDENIQKEVAENFSKWLDVVTDANGTLSISQNTADDLTQWLKERDKKVRNNFKNSVFHIGADIESEQDETILTQEEKDTLLLLKSNPSFIMVGTIEPRKGQEQTLLAFELLWKKGRDINLVIVGKQGWFVDELIKKIKENPLLDQKLFWMNSIGDHYLDELYSVCHCLIAPSKGEGFGLPLIEAAQHKMPIIARDLSVFREVAGEHAYYFEDDDNPSIIANSIENWMDLYREGKHPKSDQMPWLTWRESMEQLVDLIAVPLEQRL